VSPAAGTDRRGGLPRAGARAGAMLVTASAIAALSASSVSADQLDPVRLSVAAPAIASLDRPVAVSVTVDADAGAFAQTAQDLRLRVRLAPGECASTFAGTSGPVLLDRDIGAVPTSVAAFHAVLTGAGRATAYGVQTVCAFLEEQGDNRLYAADNSMAVDVSRACTTAGRVRALDARLVRRYRRALAHARGSSRRVARVRRAVRALAGAQRAERAACAAPGVAGG
jgi:hypothetical protein